MQMSSSRTIPHSARRAAGVKRSHPDNLFVIGNATSATIPNAKSDNQPTVYRKLSRPTRASR